ncbi:MAG: ring-hydroxylating oxygenase subunit alpha, partial [Chloroflexota bacterium]
LLHPSPHIFHPPSTRPYGQYWPKLDNDNDFQFDYEAQRTNRRYSGLPGIWPQDSGMQQSMGPIYDRTKEHLGASDAGQIRIRRRMLTAARALRRDGTPPPGAGDASVLHVRPFEALLPRSTDRWIEASRELHRVEGTVKGLGTPAGR